MDILDPYVIVISLSLVIIISFFFSVLAQKTNIPSVLMLILLGILIGQFLTEIDFEQRTGFALTLELLGIVGLIMIVLEAALDLKLTREKKKIITRSFFSAGISLVLTTAAITWLFSEYIFSDLLQAIIYAIPLGIVSSAIIIPSVANLVETKKEFMVYEGTFSDIMGIMLFYFVIESVEIETVGGIVFNIASNVVITVVLSFILSFLLLVLFHRIGKNVKFFMLFSMLVLLYSVGKLFHLSSLLMILVFGLLTVNYRAFFRGWFKQFIDENTLQVVLEDMHAITRESSFVVRTLFFVVFGITIDVNSLLSIDTLTIGMAITVIIYIIRFIGLKISGLRKVTPEIYMAPRGLITILLFSAIPATYVFEHFEPGILLYVIILSNLIMAFGLMVKSKKYRENIEEGAGDTVVVAGSNGQAGQEDRRTED